MLDIKFIRENADLVKDAVRKKHLDFEVSELLAADEKRLKILAEVEAQRAEQNALGEKVVGANVAAQAEVMTKLRELKAALKTREEFLKEAVSAWQKLMLGVPNLPDVSVPEGEGEKGNRELRSWGRKPSFDFEPEGHVTLMNALGLVDFEAGAKVAGFRGYFLKNDGLRLSLALWQYALDRLIKKGFTPLLAPSLVRPEHLLGTGYLPQGTDDLYKTQDEMYLAGTSEPSVMGCFMDQVLPLAELPKQIVAFSPCFRREAGAHGKDVKGLIRVHEFFKVEQVVLLPASHELSVKCHEELTVNAEELLQGLGLPYRVVVLCGGELGRAHVKTYDIETWLPSAGAYRETHSSSYYHDFQTRRLNIRYRDEDGKLRFAHSLNNTALATPRLLAAIVENYQQADGTVRVPEVLTPYLGYAVIHPAV